MIAGDSSEPLFQDWQTWLASPDEWASVWPIVAARAASLVEDFPVAAAMVRARLLRIHGPHGLRFRSLYQSDDAPDTSADEVETRRQIELAIRRGEKHIDAGGMLSRAEFDWHMSWNACVLGDAFAVRVWQPVPGIPTSTRWRMIDPARVCAPAKKAADPAYAGGIEVDANGRPVALWVKPEKKSPGGVYTSVEPVRIPWMAADGSRNVVHKRGLTRPGSRRGLSEFAPMMLPARMLQGVDIAYVTMKRVQASHPLLIKVDDLKAAREQYRGTRLGNLLIGQGHEVQLPPFKFEGADYRDFVDTVLRSICATWQIPWELVLGDHSARSGAASRSLWQQHYQAAEREQAQHVEQIQAHVDESILREAVARGDLSLGDDWERNLVGTYQGPPKVMPDPHREVEWATAAVALGMSKTTVFARMGEDYRDEVMQSRQDMELAEAQGMEDEEPEAEEAPATEQEPDQEPAQESEQDGEQESDPNADTQELDPQAVAALVADARRAGEQAAKSERVPPIGNITLNLSMPVTAQIPQAAAPVVHVETSEQPAPVVHVAAPVVHVAPATVQVDAPVTVHAAEQPSPTVTVNVQPTPVTIENTVEVPQRPIKAVPQRDGSVIMTPQG